MTEIEDIVREQVSKLYPELAEVGMRVQMLVPVRRLHKSRIYEIRITNDRGFSKDLVVKQRIYNPSYVNDVVSDTLKEFVNLQLLEKRNNGKFRVVRALGIAREEGILFLERVPGEKFSNLLKGFARHKPQAQRLAEIGKYFFRSGRWLKAFHESSATDRTEKIQVEESIREARRIVGNIGWPAKFAHLESALDQMQNLRDKAELEVFPVVFKHNDFQLRNIMFENGEPVVLDVGGCCPAIALHDICDFLIGLFNFNVRYPFSQFTRPDQARCAAIFLEGYFSDQPGPREAIKFHLMLCALRQFEGILLRNRVSFLRTVWAAWYYRDLMEWLAKWNIDK